MRYFQIVIFLAATASFIISILFIGSGTGDVLWRAGIAALLFDLVCIMLWPNKVKG